MSDISSNLNLPYLMPSQAQKHVTVNEAIRSLDLIIQLSIMDRDLSAPPASPVDGSRYIVAAGGSGEWSGEDGKIAAWVDGAWQYLSAKPGWTAWIADEGALFVYDGTSWTEVTSGSIGAFDQLGIGGAAPDASNKLAVASDALLFNHNGNGVQAKLNKAAAADTASVLFQTGFSGRAEFGLTGDDDWHVKVSPDGAAWTEALFVDKDDGAIKMPSGLLTVERTGTNPGVIASRVAGKAAAIGAGNNATYFMYDDTGRFDIKSQTNANILNGVAGGSTTVMSILGTGEVGIGTTVPAAALDVDGVVKVKSYTVATLPASVAGGMIYVSDDAGGAVIAFSDGTNWRRVTDRAIVA